MRTKQRLYHTDPLSLSLIHIFIGHFDKMCMKFGEEAMTREFERLLPSARKGKVLFSCDHQTPPDVSFENYKIYVRLLKKYAALAAQK